MTNLAGIIGHPLGHSVSPPMHQAAFDALGMEVRYRRWNTPSVMLPYRVEAMRRGRCLGANVTVPHKIVAMEFVDEVEPLARSIGAVNTIVNTEGRLTGHNTDAYGLVTSLKQEIGKDLAGINVLVLGAGGAARAAVFGLAAERAGSIAIANRTASRAATLASDAGPAANARAVEHGGEEFEQAAAGADLIVNCTSVGMAGGTSPGGTPVPRRAPAERNGRFRHGVQPCRDSPCSPTLSKPALREYRRSLHACPPRRCRSFRAMDWRACPPGRHVRRRSWGHGIAA